MTAIAPATPIARRTTSRKVAIFFLTILSPVALMLIIAMIIGFAKATNGEGFHTAQVATTAPATQGTADYNDGWVDMGQAMIDAEHAPEGRIKVDRCLATAPNGDALITCIDAIPLH